jgi:hypothetical protein
MVYDFYIIIYDHPIHIFGEFLNLDLMEASIELTGNRMVIINYKRVI